MTNQFYAIGYYRKGVLKCDISNCIKWSSQGEAEAYRKMYVGDLYVVVVVQNNCNIARA